MVTRREKIVFLQCTVTAYITILQDGSCAQEYLANTKETPWGFFLGGVFLLGRTCVLIRFRCLREKKKK